MNKKVNIDWQYSGKTDFINGTGAYTEEKVLGYCAGLIIPVILIIMNLTGRLNWSCTQIVISMVLGFDLGGGVISNSLNSGKRFYHSQAKPCEGKAGKLFKNKLLFACMHVHPFVVGLLFNNRDWFYGLCWYVIFIISALTVYKTPLYLQRPVSMLSILSAILINSFALEPVPGLEWFIPVLFLKIIYGHMVKEEPYRKCK